MHLTDFIRQMPKVELHVHLVGSIQPATLLQLAARNDVSLPATTVDELRAWYQFTDFPHFIEVYVAISRCVRSAADLELIAREFLQGQAAQHILYSEVTLTAYAHYVTWNIPFDAQIAALERARTWARDALGVTMNVVVDIPRSVSAEDGLITAQWVIDAVERGRQDGDPLVVALGLGGPEVGHPPEKFADSFRLAAEAGVPAVPHAGETVGPASIRGALDVLGAVRIGHGVRCIEDPALVAELATRQVPLEVCPTSNVCLKVAETLAAHPLPALLAAGLYVTLNSDDPPLFNTTLTDEYLACAAAYGWDAALVERLVFNGVDAALLPEPERAALRARVAEGFAALHGAG